LVPIAGPAGLRLGGELPEDIALSILAECQAVINGKDANSISNLL
jgi:xanthine dehydrogenase accessory factor